MNVDTELIVVGAGVIGCAVTWELARRGCRVQQFEAGRDLAQGATAAAGGVLTYDPTTDRPAAWHALASRSCAAQRRLQKELTLALHGSSSAPLWHWTGRLELALSAEQLPATKARLEADKPYAEGCVWLERDALAELEPALGCVAGGYWNPVDGYVDPVELTRGLAHAARLRGARLALGARVSQIRVARDDRAGVVVDGREHWAKHVILANGAWVESLGIRAPAAIRPIKGQIVRVRCESGCPIRHVIYGNGVWLVPRPQGLIVGATTEDVGFAEGNTIAVGRLLQLACELVPRLSAVAWDCLTPDFGFRPQSSDLIPRIGPDPEYRNVFWACGHHSNGIQMAPLTAELLADAITRGEFSPLLTTSSASAGRAIES